MSKQKSAIAGAVGLVLTVILTAIGLNVGILGATNGDEAAPASTVPDTTWATTSTVPSTTTTTLPTSPRIVTVYVDEVVPGAPVVEAQASSTPAAPSAAPSAAPAARPAPAPSSKSAAPTPAPATSSKAPASRAPTATAPAAPAPAPAADPSPTAPAATYPAYDVPGIGTVTLQHADGQIHFWAASTHSGWQYRVGDDGPREVKVEFRAGGGDGEDEREAKLKAQLKNGKIEIRVEQDD
jgi:hypothetical protein